MDAEEISPKETPLPFRLYTDFLWQREGKGLGKVSSTPKMSKGQCQLRSGWPGRRGNKSCKSDTEQESA